MDTTHTSQPINEDMTYIIENPENMRDKLGNDFDIKGFFSSEKIQKAQSIISDSYDVFSKDIVNIVREAEICCDKALTHKNEALQHINALTELAFLMKGKAETIGNRVGFAIAKSLAEYSSKIQNVDERKILVLRKHLELLESNFINKSQTLPVENIIMKSLEMLINKIGN